MSGHRFLTVSQAANYLQDGAVVAYPTEAVYGLGCDPRNEAAVRRVLKLKNRPAEAGLILNGHPIAGRTALAPGDRLRFGEAGSEILVVAMAD